MTSKLDFPIEVDTADRRKHMRKRTVVATLNPELQIRIGERKNLRTQAVVLALKVELNIGCKAVDYRNGLGLAVVVVILKIILDLRIDERKRRPRPRDFLTSCVEVCWRWRCVPKFRCIQSMFTPAIKMMLIEVKKKAPREGNFSLFIVL